MWKEFKPVADKIALLGKNSSEVGYERTQKMMMKELDELVRGLCHKIG